MSIIPVSLTSPKCFILFMIPLYMLHTVSVSHMYIINDLTCPFPKVTYCRAPFFKGYKFCEWSKKGVHGNIFHETTLAALFTMHINLHAMESPLIFSEINFIKVPKIHDNQEIYSPLKKSALQ